jgi:GT2 family glycosyltransferase
MNKIAVIIPTYNRRSYLKTLLKQLQNQNNLGTREVIPVIVIDGSLDGTREMLATDFPFVRVLTGPGNWWWTKSVNEGVKYAQATFQPEGLLFLNDDSQVGPYYVDEILSCFQQAGGNCIIGSISITDKAPVRVSFSGVKKINWLALSREHYYPSFELLETLPKAGLYPTYALNGRGTFMKLSLFNELGHLNEESFPQYGSDDDLALRAWKRGQSVLLSYSCRVIDRTGETSSGSAFRRDPAAVFFKSFFCVHSVNYIPKQLSFFYRHGIKILLPFYFVKFLLGTSYAYFLKYKHLKHEL